MFRKIFSLMICAVLCVCSCLCFVACNRDDGKIRLSEVTHSIFYAPQYLAMALGYFAEYDIEIELTNAGGADNVMTSLIANEADVGLMGCEQGIYVVNQNMTNHPIVFGQLTKRDGSFLLGRTQDFSWNDLENKTVLMGRRGGMPAMILQYILNNKGYYDGVNITMNYDIQFNLLGSAFAGGTGDFVPLFEPVASQMQQENKGFIVSGLGLESGEIPYTVYFVNKAYLEKNPQKIENFLKAVFRATDYLFAHDNDTVAELLLPYFDGTTKELISMAIQNYKIFDVWMRSPAMTVDSFNRLQDIMDCAGELQARVNFADLIDNSIANRVN